jgi:hypothetical protein
VVKDGCCQILEIGRGCLGCTHIRKTQREEWGWKPEDSRRGLSHG